MEKTDHISAGYRAYNGHVFSQCEADAYNRLTDEINREKWPATKEFLKDQRHRLFVAIIEGE